MIGAGKVLGVIPARGGSKGVPGKNLVEIGGKPLIAWTIETAQESIIIDRLILSSDAPDIIAVASQYGCEAPFVRPAEISDDQSSSADVILHALEQMTESYEYLVLLQPTSPFRTTVDIDACLTLCQERGAPAAVSVSISEKSPDWMYRIAADNTMQPVLPVTSEATRRQDLDEIYVLNGAVFVARTDDYQKSKSFLGPQTVGMVMPTERAIDIDTPLDVIVANALCDAIGKRLH